MENRVESESCPFRRFSRRHMADDDAYNYQTTSLGASMASNSEKNGDPLVSSEEFVRDESNLLSLHPWIFKKESYQDGMNIGVKTTRGSLRSRMLRRFSVKPVNFMCNYIAPFAEHVDIEEYVLGSPPNSPTPRFRPFVVTDGSRIISKSSFDSFCVQPENGLYKEDFLHGEADGISLGAKRAVIGVPLLPGSRNLRRKSSELQHVSVEAAASLNPSKVSLLKGSHDGMLPFVIGISIGMISAHISKRTEVDKLNKLLKQSEDLVQDLQEELEMKDSFSVKELANCTYESQTVKHWNSKQEESTVLMQNHKLTPHSTSPDEHDQLHLNKAGENPESLRKIEAELEAELERLDQNMNGCSVEQGMSLLSEFDPYLIDDVVHGELRADNLALETPESQAKSHDDTGTASTTQTYNANYCVSPKELSLRLHQVIQSRLEERIQDLERELLQSQRQLQVMETESQNLPRTPSNSDMGFSSNEESPQAMNLNSTMVERELLQSQMQLQVMEADSQNLPSMLSNSDMGFSSNEESPRAMKLNSALVHPFCLNLVGEALDAYDEAYQEFMQVTGKEEGTLPPIDKRESIDIHNSTSSCSSLPWESILWSRGSNETPKYEDEDGENDNFSDEEGKALIQQLVEKTKRGSPAVINAQRMFLLMDE